MGYKGSSQTLIKVDLVAFKQGRAYAPCEVLPVKASLPALTLRTRQPISDAV